MASSDLLWVFVYPALLLVAVGIRVVSVMQQPNIQAHKKVAQASYWGEYADSRNTKDRNEIIIR
jgi:hypothetical protein